MLDRGRYHDGGRETRPVELRLKYCAQADASSEYHAPAGDAQHFSSWLAKYRFEIALLRAVGKARASDAY
jgi:hypothetical protein